MRTVILPLGLLSLLALTGCYQRYQAPDCTITRDARGSHRASRYCHQFHFLPAGGGADKDEPAVVQAAKRSGAAHIPIDWQRFRAGTAALSDHVERAVAGAGAHRASRLRRAERRRRLCPREAHHGETAARAGGKCLDWLEDWARVNPPYRGWNWTSALEVGVRLVQFTWIDACLSAWITRTGGRDAAQPDAAALAGAVGSRPAGDARDARACASPAGRAARTRRRGGRD